MNGIAIAIPAIVVGGVIGYFVGCHFERDKWRKFADAEIDSVKQEYAKIASEIGAESEKHATPGMPVEGPRSLSKALYDSNDKDIKRHDKIDYSRIAERYKGIPEGQTHDSEKVTYISKESDDSEDENTVEEDDEESECIEKGLEEEEFMKSHKNDAPRLIKVSQVGELDWFGMSTLLYYEGDNTLVIEDSEDVIPEDEVRNYVGDCLTKYGFTINDEAIVYVRNFQREVDYEVIKIHESYSESDPEDE